MSRRNPISYGNSYFPPWEETLAYHSITLGQTWKAAEENFLKVWKSGWILSAASRREGTGQLMGTDVLAGDDENIFLSVSNPIAFQPDMGYYFAFYADDLIKDGAQVGTVDLLEVYRNILGNLYPQEWKLIYKLERAPLSSWPPEIAAAFRARVKLAKDIYRLSGRDAIEWIDWVCKQTDEPWMLIQGIQNAAESNGFSESVPTNVQQARHVTEIVKEHHLDLSKNHGLVGVCFRHIYFDYNDFIDLFDADPGRDLYADVGYKCRDKGYPYRCPSCQEPLVPGVSAKEVLDYNPWVTITTPVGGFNAVPCENCQEYLVLTRGMTGDPYEAEMDQDLLVPFEDVTEVVPWNPGSCL